MPGLLIPHRRIGAQQIVNQLVVVCILDITPGIRVNNDLAACPNPSVRFGRLRVPGSCTVTAVAVRLHGRFSLRRGHFASAATGFSASGLQSGFFLVRILGLDRYCRRRLRVCWGDFAGSSSLLQLLCG